MEPIIHNVNGHYEAYDRNGNFLCSGDTKNETKEEAERCLSERR
jgi:hypothetical protein